MHLFNYLCDVIQSSFCLVIIIQSVSQAVLLHTAFSPSAISFFFQLLESSNQPLLVQIDCLPKCLRTEAEPAEPVPVPTQGCSDAHSAQV